MDSSGYESVISDEGRVGAGCWAHARMTVDELVRANSSEVAAPAIHRIAWPHRIEAEGTELRVTTRQNSTIESHDQLQLPMKSRSLARATWRDPPSTPGRR